MAIVKVYSKSDHSFSPLDRWGNAPAPEGVRNRLPSSFCVLVSVRVRLEGQLGSETPRIKFITQMRGRKYRTVKGVAFAKLVLSLR